MSCNMNPVMSIFGIKTTTTTTTGIQVFLVKKTTGSDEGNLFAMKVLKKASIVVHTKDTEHTRAERDIMGMISHPFIVNLSYAFQTEGKLYLIMQYASGGELFTCLQKEGLLLEDTAKFYLAEMIVALEHLHSNGIIYRDLKPENILLDKSGHVLLTDFGLSKVALGEEGMKTRTFCGTIEFMAPEILSRQPYGNVVDWWSFGTVMYDMLVGSPPFTGGNRKQLMDKIMVGKPKFPNYLTADAQDLLKKLLKKTPETRLGVNGAEEIKRHPFFKKVNWASVAAREIHPPIIPVVVGAEDVSNFDAKFTGMPVVDSPVEAIKASESYKDAFKGFSYVAPIIYGLSPSRSPKLGLATSAGVMAGRSQVLSQRN